MSLNTWSRTGSEKAQSSQTIRILLKTLQYLAEDATTDDTRYRSFLNVASAVIKSTFNPSPNFSANEQVSVVFNTMGWKNTQITLTSANDADILLGSNRHLDQDPDSIEGLTLLVKTLSTALGSYLFDREASASVEIDIHSGPTYRIKLRALDKSQSSTPERTTSPAPSEPRPTEPQSTVSTSTRQSPSTPSQTGTIETSQIFLPVISSKISEQRLHLILQDVLVEFCKSWHGENPIENSLNDERENVVNLITFLTNKSAETEASNVDVGAQIGNYFGHALLQSYSDEQIISQEILDGSAVGSIIRDIKSRSLCYLSPGEKCGPEMGGESREICDFAMGLWQGCLSQLMEDKTFRFSGFYPAGRRDPYCLMEFEVS